MKTETNLTYVYTLASITAMGGLLFGYDWVVIGGAKPFYEVFFKIMDEPTLKGWAVSSALIGCIIGALGSSLIADKWGRKKPLILAGVLFFASALGSGIANQYDTFIIYRIIGGIGIGLSSALSPMYIAEIAPSKYRGRFVSLNQFTIVLGILLAQIVNYFIADVVTTKGVTDINSWNVQWGWRYMFWAEMIPAGLFSLLMFWVPESPRFLLLKQRWKVSHKILNRLGGTDYADKELNKIKSTLHTSSDQVGLQSLFRENKYYPLLLLGIVLAIFQQWCGINIIFNYADEIFTSAGYQVGDMLFNIVITGTINLIFTLLAMKTVDTWGRRRLMLLGAGGLAITYAVLGSMYFLNFSGWPVLVLVLLGIAIYAMSLAPITWVVLSEIFPNHIRGAALSLATVTLWIASFILTFTFPILNEAFSASGTFWIYSIICVLGFFFIWKKLPETKGKTLEELEIELTDNNYES